jgi:hypothetical protein
MENVRFLIDISEKISNCMTLRYNSVMRQGAFFASAPVDDNLHSATPIIRGVEQGTTIKVSAVLT